MICALPFREQGARFITQTSTMINYGYCLALGLDGHFFSPSDPPALQLHPAASAKISSVINDASEGLTDESCEETRAI
jgi:hypothetical protein